MTHCLICAYRRPADASETTRDVEVTFDLRDHGDQSNIARLARISWRGDTVEEQPVRGALLPRNGARVWCIRRTPRSSR